MQMRLWVAFLKPYMSKVHVRIIERLMADNDRLNREWKEKYYELEREMWYWKDKYQDEVLTPGDKD